MEISPRAADRLAASIARRMYPAEPLEVIEGRIKYLRVIPERLLDARFKFIMNRAGLRQLEGRPWPLPSLFKLGHQLVVWQRELSSA